MLAWQRKQALPWIESMVVSNAAENDLTVFKENWSKVENPTFYGDKIYHNRTWFEAFYQSIGSEMRTPLMGKQWNKAADSLYSKAVSAIRQPIESLFNGRIQKTDIQRASKVRSTKGLLVHLFAKSAAAFIYCIFNP